MSRKLILIGTLLFIVPMLLAACGGGGVSADDAENAIRAGFEGDLEEAEEHICEADLANLGEAEAMPEGAALDISCEEDGDQMRCNVTASGMPEDVGGDFTVVMTFDVEDGKLCNPEVTLPE